MAEYHGLPWLATNGFHNIRIGCYFIIAQHLRGEFDSQGLVLQLGLHRVEDANVVWEFGGEGKAAWARQRQRELIGDISA
jgi:hypothetical protein